MCLNSPTLPFLPCFITFCSTHSYTSYFYEIFATCYKLPYISQHKVIMFCIYMFLTLQGAAFGFSNIASQAQEQLAPYLPTLVPRLYRYKYDPSPRIQLAMSNIWGAVVPQSKKTVDKYLKEILADLIANLNSNLWRNREARCVYMYVQLS